eukprot:1702038-Rhodomonas_salina.1
MKAWEKSKQCISKSCAAAMDIRILPAVLLGTGAKVSTYASPFFIWFPITTRLVFKDLATPVL